jgi:hypothetical protein
MAAVIVAEIGDTGRFPGPAYWSAGPSAGECPFYQGLVVLD